MRTIMGSGCWPGRATGTVTWVSGDPVWDRGPVADRAGEILRLRAAVGQGVHDVEDWSEAQPSVAGRLALQTYREALLEDAWVSRICRLIDTTGLPAAAAAVEAAGHVAAVLGRAPDLADRARALRHVATWLAGRLAAQPPAPKAILAAVYLSPLQLVDLAYPALLAGPEPAVMGRVPLIWGVPGLGPDWAGRRITFADMRIEVDI